MRRRVCRFLMVMTVVGGLASIIAWYTIRYVSTERANNKAAEIIRLVNNSLPKEASQEQRLIAITSWVFKNFKHKDPSTIFLYKFRPYVTSRYLPEFIRLPSGVMEVNIGQGFCDNAARMLAFILQKEGLYSAQLDLVTGADGHSVLQVNLLDKLWVFLDPFFGYVVVDRLGKLTDIETAKRHLLEGEDFDDVFIPLSVESDDRFYKNIKTMHISDHNNSLSMIVKLPQLNAPLILGKVDGRYEDVKKESLQNGLTPYWHYMGHKYSREWVRILEVQQPVKIVMILVSPVENGILIATPSPEIQGNKMTWKLKRGERLILQDGLAKISLRRLNSFIYVDQIEIFNERGS